MRLAVTAALVIAAVFAAVASAATSATGEIKESPSPNQYNLAVRNTGTETIVCMEFTAAQGVEVTSADGPGFTQRIGTRGFAAQEFSIPPGGVAYWTFTTAAPYPENAGGTLKVSPNCEPGSDVDATVTGPTHDPFVSPTPTPTEDPNAPCRCKRFAVRAVRPELDRSSDGVFLGFAMSWGLVCSVGTGGCRATFDIEPPEGFDMRQPDKTPIACRGRCDGSETGRTAVSLRAPARRARAPVTYVVRIRRTCQGRKLQTLKLRLRFDDDGRLSRKRSDLDGDGHRDGT